MSCLGIPCKGCSVHAHQHSTPQVKPCFLSQPCLKPSHRVADPFFQRHAWQPARLRNACKPRCSDFSRSRPPGPLHSSAPESSKLPGFLQRQTLLAAGALTLSALLVLPIARQWQKAHKPVTDPVPAGVWLPRATDHAKQPQQHQHALQRAAFGLITSNLPAASGRLLRISDAILMQLTVTLQQVNAP